MPRPMIVLHFVNRDDAAWKTYKKNVAANRVYKVIAEYEESGFDLDRVQLTTTGKSRR